MATVRTMNPEDAAAVAPLLGNLGYPSTTADVARRMEQISRLRDQALFVAENDGTIVGWVHVYARAVLEHDVAAEVVGIVVDPNARRQGIGKALLARVEQWAKEHGLDCVRIGSASHRTDAHAFYETLGYQKYKKHHRFMKEL